MRGTLACLAALCAPGLVAAEGFSVADLGSAADDGACLGRAERMFEAFADGEAVGRIVRGEWSVMAFDLVTRDYEAVVACNHGPGGAPRATMVVFSGDAGDEAERGDIVRRLKDLWEG